MHTETREVTIKERMLIASLLPERGHVMDLRILRDLENELSFTAQEQATLKLRQAGNGVVQWDQTQARRMVRKVEFPPRAVEIIAERLRQLDTDGQLHKDFLDLYEWFIATQTASALEVEPQ